MGPQPAILGSNAGEFDDAEHVANGIDRNHEAFFRKASTQLIAGLTALAAGGETQDPAAGRVPEKKYLAEPAMQPRGVEDGDLALGHIGGSSIVISIGAGGKPGSPAK